MSGPYWTYVEMGVVVHQRDRLTVLSILLDTERDFQFRRDFHRIYDESTFTIVKFPIRGYKSFNDTFARGVLVLIDVRLSFLCIFSTVKACDSDEGEPIENNRLGRVDERFLCLIE